MKQSITDFKTGMLQRGKVGGKGEMIARNGGPCLIFTAHGRLNQEDHHRLEAHEGYTVNPGQRDLQSDPIFKIKKKKNYYKITTKPTVILKTVTFKSIHFFRQSGYIQCIIL